MIKQKVLILGAGGMIGHKLFMDLSNVPHLDVYATTRSTTRVKKHFNKKLQEKLIGNVDARKLLSIKKAIRNVQPDTIINCIGITKQLISLDTTKEAIEINALFPHQLAKLCRETNTRLIHLSTDCVYDGVSGGYTENDAPNATDVYGQTKALGELHYDHCLTIRKSCIGHELTTAHGLLGWFLNQEKETKGYTHAIYSGMPTVEFARVIATYILPNKTLHGLYQISTEPISKYDLLTLIAAVYKKNITIHAIDSVKIDRSLNSDRFRNATGYVPPSWSDLIKTMHHDYDAASIYAKK